MFIAIILAACSEKTIQPQVAQQTESRQETSAPAVAVESAVNDQLQSQYQAGVDAMKNGEHSKAQRIFREFIRNNPKLAGAYTNLALIHFEKEENERSLKLVARAIELNSQQPQAFNLRAQLLIKKGKINQAKEDYLSAIQLKPDYANAQYNLALLYDIYLQELAFAIKHYEIYLSLINYPDEPTQEWVDQLKRTLANG
jgi:tetratricopeptide (TPR) repeat protein